MMVMMKDEGFGRKVWRNALLAILVFVA